MKIKNKVLMFLLITVKICLYGQTDPSSQMKIKTWPEYQVPVRGQVLIDIEVEVPKNHHIYLSYVKEPGYSILTRFSLKNNTNVKLLTVTNPKGEILKNDRILKGKGIFTLKLETLGKQKADTLLSLPYSLKIQMCNDKTGVCYPPYDFEKELKLRFIENRPLKATRSSGDSINWLNSHKTGLSVAKDKGMKLFVLITAPSWCGPCQYMEAETFQDTELIDFINNNFIPVRIEDQIDGARNPELYTYDFSGYPTYLVATPQMEVLYQDAGTISASGLLDELSEFKTDSTAVNDDFFTDADDQEQDSDTIESREFISQAEALFRFRDGTGCAITSDGRYALFDLENFQLLMGYPKRVSQEWPDLAPYLSKLRAAMNYDNGRYYLFLSDNSYLAFNENSFELIKDYPKKITSKTWKGVESYGTKIEAALNWQINSKAYFFLNTDQYLRFDHNDDKVDAGYPYRTSNSTWPGLGPYVSKLEAAVSNGYGMSWFITSDGKIIKYDNKQDKVVNE